MILPGWITPVAAGLVLLISHGVAYNHGVGVESNRRDALLAAEVQTARQAESAQATTIQTEVARTNEALDAIPDAGATIERLRNHSATLQRQLSEASTAAQRGETATGAAMVLSELLDRANARIGQLEPIAKRATELAALYDAAVARGNLCVATYEAM